MTDASYSVPDLGDSEQALVDTFGDLPEVGLVKLMTYNLGGLIERCPMLSEISPDLGPRRSRCHAVFFISIRMLRAVRSATWLLAVGYQLEAAAIERLALELTARLDPIMDDESGAEADRWLSGKGGGGVAAAFRAIAPDDAPPNAIFQHLSTAVHADPRAVMNRLAEGDDDVQLIHWEPHRDALATRASLIMLADLTYGTIMALAHVYELEINQPEVLEEAHLHAGQVMDELVHQRDAQDH